MANETSVQNPAPPPHPPVQSAAEGHNWNWRRRSSCGRERDRFAKTAYPEKTKLAQEELNEAARLLILSSLHPQQDHHRGHLKPVLVDIESSVTDRDRQNVDQISCLFLIGALSHDWRESGSCDSAPICAGAYMHAQWRLSWRHH